MPRRNVPRRSYVRDGGATWISHSDCFEKFMNFSLTRRFSGVGIERSRHNCFNSFTGSLNLTSAPALWRFCFLLVAIFIGAGAPSFSFAETPQAATPQQYVVGLSPFLDKSVKDDVYRGMIRLLVQDLPLNSNLSIYDAFELKTISQVALPDAHVFKSAKTRANQFAPAIRDLKAFLAQEHAHPTNAHLHFDSAIRLPQFLDFLADNLPASNSNVNLLLIGSPLYEDAKEPGFSMIDGYFPSDGHLQASRDKSIFGFSGEGELNPRLVVHWIYFGDPWVNDLHKEKVTRFWTLYLERRSAQLGAFTGDLAIGLDRFRSGSSGASAASKQWAIDRDQRKIEMLRVSRSVEATDWLTQGSLSETSQTPPNTLIGPMKIGIRWKNNIDLDLYSSPRPGAQTLFFQHVRSPEGYYYKDHRSSPGKEYEFIEFETPVDVREVEAFVNFYKGSCPGGPRGEVRIEFDGRIYGATFAIAADEGNQGRNDRSQGEFWTRIPVLEILKLDGRERAAH